MVFKRLISNWQMKTAPSESKLEPTFSKKDEHIENNFYINDDSEDEVDVDKNDEEDEFEPSSLQQKISIKKDAKNSALKNVETSNAHDDVENLATKAAIPAQSQKIKKRQRQSEESSRVVEDTKNVFSFSGLLSNSDWDPAKDPTNKEYILNNFGYDKNNTLAMKLTLPSGTNRWSFNICPPDHRDSTNILLHFNPRYGNKKELIMNDKQGTWGTALRQYFSSLNGSSGGHSGLQSNSIELVVHIKEEGFAIFVNGSFCVFYEHRRRPDVCSSLRLTLPAIDDNGNPERAVFHKIWWGERQPSLEVPANILAPFQGKSIGENPSGLKTITVSGLPGLYDLKELHWLEELLLVLFGDFSPEFVNIVPGGKGMAYVRLESVNQVEEAINALDGSNIEEQGKPYTLNLTKYDGLMI
jgi:hypothetical protein